MCRLCCVRWKHAVRMGPPAPQPAAAQGAGARAKMGCGPSRGHPAQQKWELRCIQAALRCKTRIEARDSYWGLRVKHVAVLLEDVLCCP